MTDHQKCPCCGRPLRSVFDKALDAIPLAPIERKLVNALAQAYPDGLTNRELIEAIYGDDPDGGPVTARNCINVRLNTVRKRIRNSGWTVGAVKRGGSGVRLIPAETVSA